MSIASILPDAADSIARWRWPPSSFCRYLSLVFEPRGAWAASHEPWRCRMSPMRSTAIEFRESLSSAGAALRDVLGCEPAVEHRHLGSTSRGAVTAAQPRRVAVPDRARLLRDERAGVAPDAERRRARRSRRPSSGDRVLSVDPDVVSGADRGPRDDQLSPPCLHHRAVARRRHHRRALDADVSIDRAFDCRAKTDQPGHRAQFDPVQPVVHTRARRSPACSWPASARSPASR